MFLRGDVNVAKSISGRSYSRQQVFDSMLIPTNERPYFTPGFPLDLPLEHEVRIASLTGPTTQAFSASDAPNPIVSDTGQLAWFTTPTASGKKNGLVTVDTPRSQALVGFIKARNRSVTNLAAEVDNSFCTILLSSMDQKPIASSANLLLVAGGPVENSGQTWNAVGTDLTEWGATPTRVETVRGSITLRGLEHARSVSLQAIDGAGQPLGSPIQAAASRGGWKLPLGRVATTWYRIDVLR
jgi:hypothetical protein